MSETTRTIVTRIQNKYDPAAEWLLNNPTLLVGEIGYESDTGKFKIGDGKTEWKLLAYAAAQSINGDSLDTTNKKVEELQTNLDNIELLDTKITLEEDFYTSYNIGKIKTASESNPVKIGEKGWTIRQMFNYMFKAEAEVPTVTLPSLSLNITNDSKSIEYGKEVTFYATITANTGRLNSSYYSNGYTTNTGVTWNELYLEPTNDTFDVIKNGITSGTNFKIPTKSAYYAVANGGTLSGKAFAPKGYTSTEITAKNNLGQDTDVKISSDTLEKESSEASTKVSAGYIPYTYILSANIPDVSLPIDNRSKNKPSSITVSGGAATTYLYIFVPTSDLDIKSIKSGGFGVPFTKVETSKSYIVNNDKSTTYKVFQTDSTVVANTFDIE